MLLERIGRFMTEVITDFVFLPSLWVVYNRGRHFEFFIGVLQFFTSFMYNVCDSTKLSLFLDDTEWHEMANVTSITYALFLGIFLMGNTQEKTDNMLRYLSFSIIWIAQLKDRYWMEETQYTLFICLVFAILTVVKFAINLQRSSSKYHRQRLIIGGVASVLAGFFFWLSQDDGHDLLRWKHGASQVFFGVALFHLWQVTNESLYRSNSLSIPITL